MERWLVSRVKGWRRFEIKRLKVKSTRSTYFCSSLCADTAEMNMFNYSLSTCVNARQRTSTRVVAVRERGFRETNAMIDHRLHKA